MGWYDIFEDWELIEASFAMQYGIRLSQAEDMDWNEFAVLLSGIMPETPLGTIVKVRSETDKNVLKHFSPEQKKIRNDWKLRKHKQDKVSEKEKESSIFELKKVLEQTFGRG